MSEDFGDASAALHKEGKRLVDATDLNKICLHNCCISMEFGLRGGEFWLRIFFTQLKAYLTS